MSIEGSETPYDPLKDAILLPPADHTKAKHVILKEYLNGWFPIIGRWSGRMVYLDGFAGSGEYTDNTYGSPIIAVDSVKDHFLRERITCEVVFIFVEIHEGRFLYLQQLMEKRYGQFDSNTETYASLPKTYKFDLRCDDFNRVASGILGELEKNGMNLAPTLAFIDPWGYTLDVDILARILKFRKCELLVTYMAGFINRFASEKNHRDSIMKTLGLTSDQLDAAAAIKDSRERELVWLRFFNEAVVRKTTSLMAEPQPIYTLYFKMLDKNNNLLYYLAYFTKNPKGIEVMKRAMQKAGAGWSYRFSDHDFKPGQSTILDYTKEEPWLRDEAEAAAKHFAGKTVMVDAVEEWVLLNTIWLFRKDSLKLLLVEGRLEIVRGGKTKGSMPAGSMLRFR